MVWPNGGNGIPTVTSEFNPARKNPVTGVVQPHNGIDLVGWDVVVAPFAGTIIYAGYNGSAGNEVRIRRDNGDVFRLLHNRAFIRTGGRVSEGEPVAYMGTTGQSTGKHCHYETKPGGGAAINPRDYMARNSGAPANVGGGQRTAGPNGVRRRSQPSSSAAEAGEMLAPGTVGNFDGWIHGENVDGNDVWYRGISGHWFWSGGFKEGANGTGLADLNPKNPPANVGGGQRTADGDGVRRRTEPTSKSAEAGEMLAPGVVGNFDGWRRGESVNGNDVWFRGVSGNWFWSGGFVEGPNTSGLADLNPATPPPAASSNERTAGSDGVRRRSLPSSKAAEAGEMLAPGTVGTFDGWTRGESVNGNDVWFRGALSGHWFWSGGFTSTSTAGLPEVPAPSTPTEPSTPTPPKNPDNPRGLPSTTPVYPGAVFGLLAPLGDGARGSKGTPPNVVTVPVIIDRAIEHRTGNNGDELDWFSYKNSRGSCPTWYIRKDGTVIELIRPKMKPALTGPEWNWRTVGWELQGAGDGTEDQLRAVAHLLAWLASFDGRELDGIPVSFKLDREHFINHREVQATDCPGDWWAARMDAQLELARTIYAEKYAPAEPDPEPQPTLPVDRTKLEQLYDWLKGLLGR